MKICCTGKDAAVQSEGPDVSAERSQDPRNVAENADNRTTERPLLPESQLNGHRYGNLGSINYK